MSGLTPYLPVCLLRYRAPELLLGPPFFSEGEYVQSKYGPPVDMWAIGCLMVSCVRLVLQ